MTRLMDELRSGVLAEEKAHRADLNEICAEAVRRCADAAPRPSLEVRDRSIEVIVNRERLLQVLEHVIRNAQQATPPEGSVTVCGRPGRPAGGPRSGRTPAAAWISSSSATGSSDPSTAPRGSRASASAPTRRASSRASAAAESRSRAHPARARDSSSGSTRAGAGRGGRRTRS